MGNQVRAMVEDAHDDAQRYETTRQGPDPAGVDAAAIVGALGDWFQRHGRSLPWRGTRDPYAILVSEVMLQQTRVEAVIPYYQRFLARFPTLERLAAAETEEVLRLWEGLGYYHRARHLHQAAQRICREHGGEVPSDVDALRRLPGVGAYTAGAVASIAFDQPVAAVDGNVRRVLARVLGEEGDPRQGPGAARIGALAAALVRAAPSPGTLNQALMDLGALICVPRQPRCTECPLWGTCVARRTGHQARIPAPGRTAARPTERWTAALLILDGAVVLRRRPEVGLLAGLWELPMVAGHGPRARRQLEAWFQDRGWPCQAGEELERTEWAFSHVRWVLRLIRMRKASAASRSTAGDALRERSEEVHLVPLPAAERPVPAFVRRWLERHAKA